MFQTKTKQKQQQKKTHFLVMDVICRLDALLFFSFLLRYCLWLRNQTGLLVNGLYVCYSASCLEVKINPSVQYLAGRHSPSISSYVLPPGLSASGINVDQSYLIVSVREHGISTGFNKTYSVFLNFENKTIFLLLKPTKWFGNNNIS